MPRYSSTLTLFGKDAGAFGSLFQQCNEFKELFGMENQLSSSGIFSHDTQHCRFSKRFRTDWHLVAQVLKHLKTETSSCLRSTTTEEKQKRKKFVSMIVENSFEILNLSTMICDFFPWLRSTLCHDQVIKWARAKMHVYSDSILFLGKDAGSFRSE